MILFILRVFSWVGVWIWGVKIFTQPTNKLLNRMKRLKRKIYEKG